MRDKGFWNTQTHVKLTTTKKVYKNSLINKSEKIAQLYITLVNTNQQANEKKQPNKGNITLRLNKKRFTSATCV